MWEVSQNPIVDIEKKGGTVEELDWNFKLEVNKCQYICAAR
jgi:hypothetical protein